jgi:hypothetical protein
MLEKRGGFSPQGRIANSLLKIIYVMGKVASCKDPLAS